MTVHTYSWIHPEGIQTVWVNTYEGIGANTSRNTWESVGNTAGNPQGIRGEYVRLETSDSLTGRG